MKGAVELQLSENAQSDLRDLGTLARRLLATTIRDRILAPSGIRRLPADHADKVQESGWAELLSNESAGWYVLDVGDYAVILRPLLEDGQVAGAVVARVLRKDELNRPAGDETPRPAVASDGN